MGPEAGKGPGSRDWGSPHPPWTDTPLKTVDLLYRRTTYAGGEKKLNVTPKHKT